MKYLVSILIFSPDGKKIRSKPQLARQLGEQFDLSAFDFRSGRINHSQLRKSKRPQGPYDFTRGLSVSLKFRASGSIQNNSIHFVDQGCIYVIYVSV